MPAMPGDRLFGAKFEVIDNDELLELWRDYMASVGNEVKPRRAAIEARFPSFFRVAEEAMRAIHVRQLPVDRIVVKGMQLTAYAPPPYENQGAQVQSETFWIGV